MMLSFNKAVLAIAIFHSTTLNVVALYLQDTDQSALRCDNLFGQHVIILMGVMGRVDFTGCSVACPLPLAAERESLTRSVTGGLPHDITNPNI